MNRFIAITENELPRDFTGIVWRPWVNVSESDLPLLPQMAARKHLRERGGLAEDEKRLKLFVSIRKTADSPAVEYTELNIWPE